MHDFVAIPAQTADSVRYGSLAASAANILFGRRLDIVVSVRQPFELFRVPRTEFQPVRLVDLAPAEVAVV